MPHVPPTEDGVREPPDASEPAPGFPSEAFHAAAAALAALLPERLGPFAATERSTTRVDSATASIRAERPYRSGSRTARVELHTGRIDSLREVVLAEGERPLLSDTSTRWRTDSVRGYRVRIAADEASLTSSRAYVALGDFVVGRLEVRPPDTLQEPALLLEQLDLVSIERAGMAPPR